MENKTYMYSVRVTEYDYTHTGLVFAKDETEAEEKVSDYYCLMYDEPSIEVTILPRIE